MQQAFFVITDITGYTAFLTGSEAEHAQEIMHSLMELLVEHNRPPLIVSKLEGDAVFSYAPQGSFLQGQTFLELLEATYADFRTYREQMRLNTTCNCRACANIPNLDLKFFLHFGSYSLMKVSGREELSGPDVILVHRLLKNHIGEKTGKRAFIFITQSAIQALGLEAFTQKLIPHQEEYEHLGLVDGYVYCMHQFYLTFQERGRCLLEERDVAYEYSLDLPYSPSLVWDYITQPETRGLLMGAEAITVDGRKAGRIDTGTTYHCVHGKRSSAQLILDWKPVDYYTWQGPGLAKSLPVKTSLILEPSGNHTVLKMRSSSATGKKLFDKFQDMVMARMFKSMIPQFFDGLSHRIQADIASHQILISAEAELRQGEVEDGTSSSRLLLE